MNVYISELRYFYLPIFLTDSSNKAKALFANRIRGHYLAPL